jgi:serine/threonine protein kinase
LWRGCPSDRKEATHTRTFRALMAVADKPLAQYLASGGFAVVEELGNGSCGNVYRCLHENGVSAALKVFKRDFDQFAAYEEIKALAVLSGHASIVTVYDVSPCGRGVLMELMGSDLLSFIKRAKDLITGDATLRHMRSILAGLDFMHSNALLHGDVKPANVLVSVEGDAKLADLSLVLTGAPVGEVVSKNPRDYSLASLLYLSLVLAGTPAGEKGATVFLNPRDSALCSLSYRPPECMLGANEYTAALDVFSAGAIAFELLRGSPAFPGNYEIDVLFKTYKRSGSPSLTSSVALLPYFNSLHPRFPVPSQPFDDATFSEKLPDAIGRTFASMVSPAPEDRPSTATAIAAIDQAASRPLGGV